MGNIANEALCLKKLREWLKIKAHHHLYEHLVLLAKQTNLSFKEMKIRNNVTRWGSCSSEGQINLCCKLLFLQPALMRHVLLHELCHTKIMHHGNDFWQLLMQFDPAAKTHTTQLRKASIPFWIG
jgi:hypothetical protein